MPGAFHSILRSVKAARKSKPCYLTISKYRQQINDQIASNANIVTVMILSFRTYRSGQTVQIQIRLLLEEQSDQGLHCLNSICTFLMKFPMVWCLCLNFRYITAKFSGVQKFRNFMVFSHTSNVSPIITIVCVSHYQV